MPRRNPLPPDVQRAKNLEYLRRFREREAFEKAWQGEREPFTAQQVAEHAQRLREWLDGAGTVSDFEVCCRMWEREIIE